MPETSEPPAAPDNTPESAPASGARAADAGRGGVWLMLIIALLLALVLMQVRRDWQPATADASELAELQQLLASERAELDAERAALGIPTHPAPAGQAAAQAAPAAPVAQPRQAAPAAAQVATAARALAAQAEQLAAQVAASDAQLASMAGQLEAARQQLAAAAKQSNNGLLDGEAETLRRGAELSAARTAQLEKELAAAKASLEAYQGAPSAAEHDDLKRLYQDALRARDFYQKRAAELEKQSAGGQPDAGEPPR